MSAVQFFGERELYGFGNIFEPLIEDSLKVVVHRWRYKEKSIWNNLCLDF